MIVDLPEKVNYRYRYIAYSLKNHCMYQMLQTLNLWLTCPVQVTYNFTSRRQTPSTNQINLNTNVV